MWLGPAASHEAHPRASTEPLLRLTVRVPAGASAAIHVPLLGWAANAVRLLEGQSTQLWPAAQDVELIGGVVDEGIGRVELGEGGDVIIVSVSAGYYGLALYAHVESEGIAIGDE